MSSLSNYNTDNTKSVILAFFFLVSSLKVQSILKFAIRGVLLSKLIWWPMSLIPFIRSFAFKCCALLAISISLNKEIMSPYSYYIKKGLVYITIADFFSYQSFFYTECTKLNTCVLYNMHLISLNKYTFLCCVRYCIY